MTDLANRALFDALQSVNRKLRAVFDAKVKERGLTLSRARALFALSRRDGLNQRELAEELAIETPTIVRLLDGMEAQGFIERRVEKSDRRAKQIHMTPMGRALAEEIEVIACGIRADLLSGVSLQDKETALAVMTAMADNMILIGRESVS
ncbi:MarR family transcriptional regulator for hemolysin [Rhizobium sp. PP-F2F-G38]|uniref:MarR family transcriptional regulator n=1 Tax=Ferranicluibacter rubi TaxID=2715133 RepID=A0AA44C9N7_9HYPH|nr:MarR family transcriptional regulator [Ferranicluibacter rubi]PYE28624.1 MarR family transcriptional regulator for hemolysin [Rhizobium sp. PP-CC-3A-592]PYE35844.1 MarR family transcriptional regulator for hemolysin [Rhizobium sp. PP-WC-1G-195]PYE46088.1 MarR family transcriptional regulator for hemolysin [Rhizobium sp. PP-F2F-G20b]PYE99338.1 MarR family transcriptional regulator for hemolysin [Rhizobium sp. PP-F2F-G38]TCP87394.1 MarR family transcriptional regulator for hemolysin [Rhizobiu